MTIEAIPGPYKELVPQLNQMREQIAADIAPVLNSANTSIPLITAADIGHKIVNSNATPNNLEVHAYGNPLGDQVHVGGINIGSTETAGGKWFVATRAPGAAALAERIRVDSTTLQLNVQLNQEMTHQFFEATGGKIHRLGDRTFFGAAVQDIFGRDWAEALRMGAAHAGITWAGTVNTSGNVVTWVSGDQFVTAAATFSTATGVEPLVGQSLLILGVRYTVTVVTSATQITVSPAPPALSGAAYQIGCGMIESGSKAQVSILCDPLQPSSQNGFYSAFQTKSQTTAAGGYAACLVAVNNHPTIDCPSWVLYSEGHRMNDVAHWCCNEFEMVNRGDAVFTDPYRGHDNKQVQTLQLGSGGGLDPIGQTNVTTALIVFNNGSFFNAGICFTAPTLAARPDGSKAAMQLALDHQIQWYSAADTVAVRMFAGADSILNVTTVNGVDIRVPNLPIADYANLHIYTTDVHAADKGGQLGLGGNRAEGYPYPFAKLKGAPETTASLAGYLSLSTLNTSGVFTEKVRVSSGGNVGIGTTTFGTAGVRNFAMANGTAPTSLPAGIWHMWAQNVTSLLDGGIGTHSGSLGTQLWIQSKGVRILSHASIGDEAFVDGTTNGSDYPSSMLTIRNTFTGDMSAAEADPATGFGTAKRAGVNTVLKFNASAGLAATNEFYGNRGLVWDIGSVTHLGKIYGASGEVLNGAGRMNLARGLFGIYQQYGAGSAGDAKGVFGLIYTEVAATGLVDEAYAVDGQLNLLGATDFTAARCVRGGLTLNNASANIADFAFFRVSTPVITAGTIGVMIGLNIADLSGFAGVTTARNIWSQGVNSLNRFDGSLEVGNKVQIWKSDFSIVRAELTQITNSGALRLYDDTGLLVTNLRTDGGTASVSEFKGIVVASNKMVGSEVANGDLTLEGTSHATKTSSYVLIQPNGGNVGVGLGAPLAILDVHNPVAGTILGLTGSGDTFKFTLSDISSYSQLSFFEGVNKKAVLGYQGSTSSGLLGGPGALVLGTLTAAPVAFLTNGAVRVTITDVGNIKIAGTATRTTTEGTNHLDIFDGTSPVGTLANGISVYSSGGECYIMDAAGNASIQSPHDRETGEWIFWSKNTVTGRVLRVDMEKMMLFLNDHFGTDFIHEYMEAIN